MQVVQACRSRHQWDAKALDLLVLISFLIKFQLICLFQ
jgi:hypothetical protein